MCVSSPAIVVHPSMLSQWCTCDILIKGSEMGVVRKKDHCKMVGMAIVYIFTQQLGVDDDGQLRVE